MITKWLLSLPVFYTAVLFYSLASSFKVLFNFISLGANISTEQILTFIAFTCNMNHSFLAELILH